MEVTGRSQVRNSAELRRFSSPHPSLFFLNFWCNFWAQMRREWRHGGQDLYRVGDPLSPMGGGLSPVGRGDRTPSLHTPLARDLFANSKKITLRFCRPLLGRQDPCRPWGGRPGAIFEIFQNGHIFLKFLFFLNIKKRKRRPRSTRASLILGG